MRPLERQLRHVSGMGASYSKRSIPGLDTKAKKQLHEEETDGNDVSNEVVEHAMNIVMLDDSDLALFHMPIMKRESR